MAGILFYIVVALLAIVAAFVVLQAYFYWLALQYRSKIVRLLFDTNLHDNVHDFYAV
jgi:hypothetical protein